ncbi:MAG: nucleotide exchange factor GrpE [Methanospirillum sp.]|nr:nucleotide exchange factor GrpE [Methanospirillum sp.]
MTDTVDNHHDEKSEMSQEDESGLVPEGSPPGKEQSPLEILQSEYDEMHEKYLRLAADFENFRKRSVRETEQRISQSVGQFARDMLEVADSLDRAAKAEGESHEGFIQIQKLLVQVLKRQEIEAYDSIGEKFDPTRHEAVAMIPSNEKEGIICDQVCRGYCLRDRIIRPAQVVISQGTASDEHNTSNE